MGASVSTNSTDIITKALTDVSSEIIQKSITTNNQNIVISVNDVEGDVTISNVDILQKANINAKALFNNLEETENANKINEEIEKITKSAISGLNIGQISTSVSTLSNIIENCIKIKNQSIAECKNTSVQNFNLTVKKVKGNVSIIDLTVKQITENFSECILSNKNTNDLRMETDTKIKQISSSKAEGLDMKWIAISIAIAFSSFAAISSNTITKLIGPIMIGIGSALSWFSYKKNNMKTVNKTVYIKENINNVPNFENLQIIKKENITNNIFDVKSYGEASLYETFNNKIALYNNASIENIENLKNDIKITDLDGRIVSGVIEIRIKNSAKYPFKRLLNYNLENNFKNLKFIQSLNLASYDDNTVYILTENFEYTHQLKIYLKYSNVQQLTYKNTYYIEPTILSYTTKADKYDLLKNTNIVIGISLIILGVVVMFISLLKK